ncbi:MAG: hypothetical protein H6R07_2532 [Proteobacteria bacterium]|nr:hypothetical protein [Pseudomonadota bacterium]
MAKQPQDLQTAELPGIPEAKRRGRVPINGKAMTAAERKARSRLNQQMIAAKDFSKPFKVPVSVEVDLSCSGFLRQIAKDQGLTIASAFELMVSEYVTSHKIEKRFDELL